MKGKRYWPYFFLFIHQEFKTPNDIPDNCAKYVKMYANGELTLPDYVKSVKICKQNEEIAQQIAKTSK